MQVFFFRFGYLMTLLVSSVHSVEAVAEKYGIYMSRVGVTIGLDYWIY
jgi:hypothetical protein